MEDEVNQEIIRSLINEIEAFPSTIPSGLLQRRIFEMGYYEEQGLKFTSDDLKLGQLYAGLAVLARDMHKYLANHPREDAALFDKIVSQVNTEDSMEHRDFAFPNYKGLPVEVLPENLATKAASGTPTVTPLGDRNIVYEWTTKPGKRFFVRLLQGLPRKFKKIICGKGGLYEQYENKRLQGPDLQMTIVSTLFTSGFSPAAFWVPLAVYMSVLLAKKGLKAYCESKEPDK